MSVQYAKPGVSVSVRVETVVDGVHVASTIDTANTRLTDFPAVAPTVAQVGTGPGNYLLTFDLTGNPVASGQTLYCRVNGSVDGGAAWSEWIYTIEVVERIVMALGVDHRWANQSSGEGFDVVRVTEEV